MGQLGLLVVLVELPARQGLRVQTGRRAILVFLVLAARLRARLSTVNGREWMEEQVRLERKEKVALAAAAAAAGKVGA